MIRVSASTKFHFVLQNSESYFYWKIPRNCEVAYSTYLRIFRLIVIKSHVFPVDNRYDVTMLVKSIKCTNTDKIHKVDNLPLLEQAHYLIQ